MICIRHASVCTHVLPYKVYTYLHFPSQQGGDDFEVRSNTFDKVDSGIDIEI